MRISFVHSRFILPYYFHFFVSSSGSIITECETFEYKTFKLPGNQLKVNEIKLTSKNEVIAKKTVPFQNLKKEEMIDGHRYLVLISGAYIDEKVKDDREEVLIPSLKEFKKGQISLFEKKEIIFNDITDAINDTVAAIYKEIQTEKTKFQQIITELKEMFLISDSTLNDVSVSLNDTPERILEKVYAVESKKTAKQDALIKKQIEKLESLNPAGEGYEEDFSAVISELAKEIPLQNRAALTHYVARRKLVLELFRKILDNKLKIQNNSTRDITEKLLHNLIFQQHSNDTQRSDLWLINEDFIYFDGLSEHQISETTINGERVFKTDDELNEAEKNYKNTLGEDRLKKRPDILLFPEEGKCIIIEFKTPEENISNHLQQVTKYAAFIRNFSKDQYDFHTFYGFFIGEAIDEFDVRSADSDFQSGYQLDYLFRPSKKVPHFFGKPDGHIYTEVIKYSDLLERARRRNDIFIKKIIPE